MSAFSLCSKHIILFNFIFYLKERTRQAQQKIFPALFVQGIRYPCWLRSAVDGNVLSQDNPAVTFHTKSHSYYWPFWCLRQGPDLKPTITPFINVFLFFSGVTWLPSPAEGTPGNHLCGLCQEPSLNRLSLVSFKLGHSPIGLSPVVTFFTQG